jgi:aryl-alcohol dehydrogenase-like predicted oxidoreductase
MELRELEKGDLRVSTIGLGCSGMSEGSYGVPDDVESVATIQRSIDLGVSFFATSDAYGNGHNEELLARVLRGRRGAAVLGTKFGNMRGPRGAIDGRPE